MNLFLAIPLAIIIVLAAVLLFILIVWGLFKVIDYVANRRGERIIDAVGDIFIFVLLIIVFGSLVTEVTRWLLGLSL